MVVVRSAKRALNDLQIRVACALSRVCSGLHLSKSSLVLVARCGQLRSALVTNRLQPQRTAVIVCRAAMPCELVSKVHVQHMHRTCGQLR